MSHKPAPTRAHRLLQRLPPIRALAWRLAIVTVVVATFALVYLDRFVHDRFQSHQFEAPARVLGAPLTLRPGTGQSLDEILWWLERLGYQPVSGVVSPGEYRQSEQQVVIHTRGYPFHDGPEPARELVLEVGSGTLTRLYSRDGQSPPSARLEPPVLGQIDTQFAEDRVLVTLDQVPPELLAGLIAVEDRQFFQHAGVSFRAIARALWVNIQAGEVRQGGSTLTQQLVKNLFLSPAQSLTRKGAEAVMAMLLERRADKQEILEAYINEVFVAQDGQRAIHGFGLAARHFFGRPISELSVAQQATLIGLLRGPSYYSPTRHPERAIARRNLVLTVMRDEGIISGTVWAQSIREPLGLSPGNYTGPYAHALDLVRRQLRVWLSNRELRRDNLRLHTTINIRAQQRAQTVLRTRLERLEAQYGLEQGTLQGALVAADTKTGQVLAVSGGRSQQVGGFNRAIDAFRPVGSTLKPVIYLTALEAGMHWWSPVLDEPVTVAGRDGSEWRPANFSGESHGSVPMWAALAGSYNQAAARTGMQLGLGRFLDRVESLGYRGALPAVPAALLGSVEMSPYQLAGLFQPMLAEGQRRPLMSLAAVTLDDGSLIARFDTRGTQVIDPVSAQSLLGGLRLVGTSGTAASASARLGDALQPAGKTGTSDGQRDSWFVGSAGATMAAVWVGADDNRELPFTGSTAALPIWTDWMAELAQPLPERRELHPNLDWVSWDGPRETPGLIRLGLCGRYQAPVPRPIAADLAGSVCGGQPARESPPDSAGATWLQRLLGAD